MLQIKKDKPQTQPEWEREEQVLLVVEYFASKETGQSVDVRFLSNVLRKRAEKCGFEVDNIFRNEAGISFQIGNLSHFDPTSGKNVTGHESKWMHNIMKEYIANPQKLILEAYMMLKNYS